MHFTDPLLLLLFLPPLPLLYGLAKENYIVERGVSCVLEEELDDEVGISSREIFGALT
jgi:hypothetical protein